MTSLNVIADIALYLYLYSIAYQVLITAGYIWPRCGFIANSWWLLLCSLRKFEAQETF